MKPCYRVLGSGAMPTAASYALQSPATIPYTAFNFLTWLYLPIYKIHPA
ncbi:hypothetical protein [Nostoc commune]|nr:hypothetical protein [Nostoc commune]